MGLIEERILKRIDRNENLLASFVGGTGSGKSFSAIRLAIELDPEFSQDNIVFSAYDCLKLVNSGKLKAGSVVVYDESGVSTGNMDYQQKEVILFTKVLQTFRESNYILLFTVPSETLMVKTARNLTHMRFYMQGKQMSKNKAYTIKIPEWDYNKSFYNGQTIATVDIKKPNMRKDGEFYWVNPKDEAGNYIKYKSFPLPPKRIIEPYLRKKLPFLHEVQKMALAQYENNSAFGELTENQREVYELACQGLSQFNIAVKLGVSQSAINQTLKGCKAKGYDYKKNKVEVV